MDMPSELVVNGVRYVRADECQRQGPTPIERWYTVAELVEMSGFSKSEINAAIRDKRLDARAPNGGTRYRRVRESEWRRFTGEA